ncbi:PAS domain-containing protein [Actinoplanes awajinensis]|uniref:Diguanylate cyclase n=1 Tax=Actinoplanes awajinensis subsp. mycoplanecinus TaxID=135947 RepID=A0A0X3VAD1_9ACTN|nr:PAS domain-containing protein [Actinoplanes awajinensis]KUL41658.1 diguanylate cyclase [Actinoplanes awajinensis subsp. mycoplanecinus]
MYTRQRRWYKWGVLSAIGWFVLGIGSAAAVVHGVRRHRPARPGPWLLLAGAVVASTVGDVSTALHRPGVADAGFYAMFVLVACSLLQLTRAGAILVDRARLIDLLAFACSAMLVVWVFVIGDAGRIGGVSAAYVIGAVLLLAVVIRLLVAAGRNPAAVLLVIGAAGVLCSDIVQPLWPNRLSESGFVVLYLAWGAAALHPSMARLTRPATPRPRPWLGRWATLLGVSVATPPIVLLIEAVDGTVDDGVVIAVAGALTLLLTITRLTDAVILNVQALTRERALRQASAALVAAADPRAVDEAVRAAIAQLIRPEAIRSAILAIDDDELAAAAVPGPAAGSPHRSWWIEQAENDHATLVCPLWLEPLAVARPRGGALILVGRRDALAVSRDTLEVLAGQAALALDRICLMEAVGRDDSDVYLRAVIGNSVDMTAVIDEDQRIRFASSSLRRLLGVDALPPLATLGDLVQPDDRDRLRQAFRGSGDGAVCCSLVRADGTPVLVEITYRDLREDRLVQGLVLTVRDFPQDREPGERRPRRDPADEWPARVNRRSARRKFGY